MKRFLFALVLILASACMFSSCTKFKNLKLVGVWENKEYINQLGVSVTHTYEFRFDGICTCSQQSSKYIEGYSGSTRSYVKTYRYEVLSNDTIQIDGRELKYQLINGGRTLVIDGVQYNKI